MNISNLFQDLSSLRPSGSGPRVDSSFDRWRRSGIEKIRHDGWLGPRDIDERTQRDSWYYCCPCNYATLVWPRHGWLPVCAFGRYQYAADELLFTVGRAALLSCILNDSQIYDTWLEGKCCRSAVWLTRWLAIGFLEIWGRCVFLEQIILRQDRLDTQCTDSIIRDFGVRFLLCGHKALPNT